ncbi:MAG: class I SAM-dependent methyltransferase [Spirochaetes bacterium]|nr:class I SAM-dependent methyltransferase [Spirochaetota bacterium]
MARRATSLAGLPVARLFDGSGDGYPPLVIDRYGGLLVAHYFPPNAEEERGGGALDAVRGALLGLEGEIRSALPEARSLLLKSHPHDAKENRERKPETLWGEEPSPTSILEEDGLRFEIRPGGSLFCGLYPDTAFLRRRLRGTVAAKVMNTFAFTGSLGIACARAELDQEILQIDSSPAALDWASANWALNQGAFPRARMRFLCDDCLNFMEREARRIERGAAKCGVVILDPPSFGRGRNKVFSLKNDARTLLAAAIQCLEADGTLVFTANYRAWPPEKLRDLVATEAARAGREVLQAELLRPPAPLFPAREPDSISVRGVLARLA